MDFAITSGWLLTPDMKIIPDARVIIENGLVVYAGPKDDSDAVLAGHDHFTYPKGFLVPGFINGHTHIGETLVRGMCDDVPLKIWLWDNIWQVEPHMKAEDCYWGTLLGCAEMIAGGTIGFCDQYFYANEIAHAVAEAGMKAFLFPSIFEPTPEARTIGEAFRAAIQVYDAWNGKDNRIFVGFGPHAPYSVSGEWLAKISEAAKARSTGIHIHLSETKEEIDEARKNWGKTPIAYCDQLGVLDEKTVVAHCVHLVAKDYGILKDRKVFVVHCPQSNMKLASGIAPVSGLNARGINVCIGTDGQASNNNLDMLEEMRTAAFIHKVTTGDPTTLPAPTVLKMGTLNPARIFGKYASGKIEKGVPADLAVFDLGRPQSVPIINPLSNLIYSASSHDCVLTVCDGQIIYDGTFKTLNVEEILSRAQKISERLIVEKGNSRGKN